MVPRAGFEHATTRSSAERSPRLSYLGTVFHAFLPTSGYGELNHLRFLKNIKLSFTPNHSTPCSKYIVASAQVDLVPSFSAEAFQRLIEISNS